MGKVTTFAFLAVFCIIIACGEPLESVPPAWEAQARVPAEYTAFRPVAVGPKGLYVVAVTRAGNKRLVVFDGEDFAVDYEAPSPDDFIASVSFRGDVGFMSVSRRTYPEGSDASLFFFTEGRWREVLVAPEYADFSVLGLLDGSSCLLRCRREGTDVLEIAKYSNGNLAKTGSFECDFAGYSGESRIIYGYRRFNSEGREIFVSADDGATWHREVYELPPHYELERIVSTATSPDALYLIARVVAADLEYYAIIRRTGAPGEGVYDLSYLAWVGPGVGQIDFCAFRDDDDGIAVGLGTTMRYYAPDWVRETVGPLQRFDYLVADPRGGYWAVRGRGSLEWHP
jgi:hypothetical protein